MRRTLPKTPTRAPPTRHQRQNSKSLNSSYKDIYLSTYTIDVLSSNIVGVSAL